MRFIYKQTVNAKFFKGNNVIFSALIVQLFKLGFQLLLGLGKLFDCNTLTAIFAERFHTLHDFINFRLQGLLLTLGRYGNLLKLRVSDDDRIVIARRNSRTESLSVLRFKVLFGCDKDVGRGIKLKIFACPLFDKMIWHNEHTLTAKSQTLHFLRCRHHREGLACAYDVGKQGISAVHDSCNGVRLVLSQRDFGIHTIEFDMTSIKFTGTEAVEFLIVELAKTFTALRIFPDPFFKCALDLLLFALCNGRFLLVQHRPFVSVSVHKVIYDTNVFEIQGFFDDLVSIDTSCTKGTVHLDVASLIVLLGDHPLCRMRNIFHLDLSSGIIRCAEKFMDKRFNILGRNPR